MLSVYNGRGGLRVGRVCKGGAKSAGGGSGAPPGVSQSDVGTNRTEDVGPVFCAKAAGDLLLDFEHAHIAFDQIVVKRDNDDMVRFSHLQQGASFGPRCPPRSRCPERRRLLGLPFFGPSLLGGLLLL